MINGFSRKGDKYLVGDKEFDTIPEAINHVKELHKNKENSWGQPTSFDELEKQRSEWRVFDMVVDLSYDFVGLLDNIIFDSENKSKGSSVRELADSYADQVDELFQKETQEKDNSMFGITMADVRKAIKSLVGKEEPLDKPQLSSNMLIYKDGDGTYRWIARYSNNLRDEDNPSEIIATESHEKFAALVKSGVVPPPELWLWHVEEWKWGEGEWVTVDKQGDHTFAVAGGYVYKEFNDLAEIMIAQTDDVLVSHGMPPWTIKRDTNDNSIIVEHITKEISPLPSWAAANKYTGFITLRENTDMAISKKDKQELMSQHGISEEMLNRIESFNTTDAQKANGLDIQTKDVKEGDDDSTGVEANETDTTSESGTPDVGETADATSETEVVVSPDVVEFMAEVNKAMSLIGATIQKQGETLGELANEIKSMKTNEEDRVATKAAQSPLASLTSMMIGSVVGNEETRVDGRTSLAKSGPIQAPVQQELSGIPFIDQMISDDNSRKGDR